MYAYQYHFWNKHIKCKYIQQVMIKFKKLILWVLMSAFLHCMMKKYDITDRQTYISVYSTLLELFSSLRCIKLKLKSCHDANFVISGGPGIMTTLSAASDDKAGIMITVALAPRYNFADNTCKFFSRVLSASTVLNEYSLLWNSFIQKHYFYMEQ